MRLVVLVALLAAPVLARAEPMDLICQGTALHTESAETFASATSSDGDSASGSATTYRKARTIEVMRIRLDGNGTTVDGMEASSLQRGSHFLGDLGPVSLGPACSLFLNESSWCSSASSNSLRSSSGRR